MARLTLPFLFFLTQAMAGSGPVALLPEPLLIEAVRSNTVGREHIQLYTVGNTAKLIINANLYGGFKLGSFQATLTESPVLQGKLYEVYYLKKRFEKHQCYKPHSHEIALWLNNTPVPTDDPYYSKVEDVLKDPWKMAVWTPVDGVEIEFPKIGGLGKNIATLKIDTWNDCVRLFQVLRCRIDGFGFFYGKLKP